MTTRARQARIILAILIAAITAGIAGIVISARALEPRLHEWVTSSLGRSLEAEVELGTVHMDWMPLRLHARNLTIRHHGRRDIPPLLVVSSFSVDLRPTDLWSSSVERVTLEGLEVNIPPKDADTGKRPLPRPAPGDDDDESGGLVVRHLIARNARLAVIPRSAGKNPKVWDIFELDMKHVGSGEPASFTASLINPIPYGKIEASGHFGPWRSNEPGTSPITGDYTFAADLGTINGLSGDLGAAGTMHGTIEQISTRGDTRTAAFRLTELDGISLPLSTTYEALVDGTNGDVDLQRVDITLGRSTLHARGAIEGTKGVKGKRVVVDLKSQSMDLAELLLFVSQAASPPARGTLTIDAAFDLPQGESSVLERVAIEGLVRADRVTFTNDAVQDKVDELSRKAQGRPTDASIDDVASRMSTTFALKNGVFTYQGLSFDIDGATVRLDGTHALRSKSVDLAGEVLLQATVSKTQTGLKSWLLKPFDPLFRKRGAGARLAIRVAGTQDQPKVAVDLGKTLRGR